MGSEVFKEAPGVKKVAIPNGYVSVAGSAFQGCTGLVEIAVADGVQFIGTDAFDGCDNVKTYYISGDDLIGNKDTVVSMLVNSGLAQNGNNPVTGVTVYTKEGSPVIEAVEQINTNTGNDINVVTVPDPYSRNTINPTPTPTPTGQKGSDGTPYGPGATEDVVNAAAQSWGSETDPAGTVFGLLKAKATKVTNSSVTVQWTKQGKAAKYVVYGNACGKANKLKRLAVVKGSSVKFTKVLGKKVAKGKYYKFMVVAFDSSNRVVSTSKIVHAATKGGKVGNDKSVTVDKKVIKKAKALKKGKTLKLKAKPVAQSKKLKVKRHRKVAYESSNPKVATVSKSGAVKAKSKGSCVIYAYAQNGVCKKIVVKVK